MVSMNFGSPKVIELGRGSFKSPKYDKTYAKSETFSQTMWT